MKKNLLTKVIKRVPLIVAAFLVIFAVSTVAFSFGYERGTQHPKEIVITGLTNITDEDVTADFGLFWEAWEALKIKHLRGEEVTDQDFVYSAIHGLVSVFNDPNTIFLPPEESQKFQEDINGNFGGIGAEIGMKDNQLIIVAPLKNSPAEKVGLISGDKILKIDDIATMGISLDEAVKNIRGLIGVEVILNILRDDWEIAKDIVIVRDNIIVPTLEQETIEDTISYISLFSFNENAPSLFAKAAQNVLQDGIKGIVLDLRNNPGGFLDGAIELAGWFVDRGEVVVSEEFKGGTGQIFHANGNEALKNIPVVILINGGSASASEILAGALRDIRDTPLVGEKSFGKGTVQELYPLRGDSQLKVTIAHWVMPSGQIIEKNGLEPDVEVPFTEEDFNAGRDPQLEEAIKILKKEIGSK